MPLNKMKYVVFVLSGHEHAIIIPNESGLTHASVYIQNDLGTQGEIVSAGFCHLNEDGPKCYGESVSLRVKSRPETDTALIKRQFYYY